MAVKFHLISGIFVIREWVCSWVVSWGIVKSKATEISFEPNTLELRYIFKNSSFAKFIEKDLFDKKMSPWGVLSVVGH